jgi:hypothetical protein
VPGSVDMSILMRHPHPPFGYLLAPAGEGLWLDRRREDMFGC